jgi:hypothetical protein
MSTNLIACKGFTIAETQLGACCLPFSLVPQVETGMVRKS